MIKFSVSQFGKPLSKHKYKWDAKKREFISNQEHLVIDFSEAPESIIKVGDYCIIKANYDSYIECGHGSYIKCGEDSTVKTKQWSYIDCENNCIITTLSQCTIDCGPDCELDLLENCIVKAYDSAEIKSKGHTAIIRLGEAFVVNDKINHIQIVERVPGYKDIRKHTITIDGKDIKISQESFENLKKTLIK